MEGRSLNIDIRLTGTVPTTPRPSTPPQSCYTSSSPSKVPSKPIQIKPKFRVYHRNGSKFSVTASLRFVLDCLAGLLKTTEGQNLLVPCLLKNPKDWCHITPIELEGRRQELYRLLHGQKITFYAYKLRSLRHYGSTVTRLSGRHQIKINRELLSAVAIQDKPRDETNIHLHAMLLTTLAHQITHYVRKLVGLNTSSPTFHISRFLPADRSQIYGNTGYMFESNFWGGVLKLFVEEHLPTDKYAKNAICALAWGKSWSINKYEPEDAPPMTTFMIVESDLLQLYQSMVALTKKSRRDALVFPLFNIRKLPERSKAYPNLDEFRDFEEDVGRSVGHLMAFRNTNTERIYDENGNYRGVVC